MDFKEFLIYIADLLDNSKIKDFAAKMKNNDTALSDEVSTELKAAVDEGMSNFMSVEAAQNNPKLEKFFKTKLFPILKGEILGNIDTEIDSVAASLFGADVAQEIVAEENTKNKLKMFSDRSKEVLKKRLSTDEGKQKVDELHEKINKLQSEYAEKLKAKDQEVESEKLKVHDTLIRSKVNEMAKSYKWREALQEETVQPVLIDKIYQKLKGTATFKYNEAGDIDVFSKDDPATLLFVNNKKMTVKDLLDKEMDPYLDKAPAKKTFAAPPQLNKAAGDQPKLRESIRASAAEFQNKTY